MSLNFTEKGKEYKYIAHREDRPDYGILSDKVFKYFLSIVDYISKQHSTSDIREKGLMLACYGCLEKLRACFLFSKRISEFVEKLMRETRIAKGSTVSYRPMEALVDFESLVFQARAFLDRFTFMLCKQYFKQDCDDFSRIVNVLSNSGENKPFIDNVISIINICRPEFDGLLIDTSEEKSLRSHLIHKSSLIENSFQAFTIHIVSENKYLFIDYNIKRFPVIGSTWKLTHYLSYLGICSLGCVLNINGEIPLSDYEPQWVNKFIDLNDFITEDSNGIPISYCQMFPSGVSVVPVLCNRDILAKTVNISSTIT